MPTFIRVLDLLGCFAFALSGALAGVKRRLDLFGVLVLAFVAATAGGLSRDLLIGAVPPAALQDVLYLGFSVLAGLITFFWHHVIERMRSPVMVFDAAGLALFAVVGTQKALAYGLTPIMAALLGMLSGIGGGVVRDVLLSRIPSVLRSELYAGAALLGSAAVVVGQLLRLPYTVVTLSSFALCFGLRLMAIRRGWAFPKPRPRHRGL